MSAATPVVLTTCRDTFEAAAIVAALEDAGVEAIVEGELMSLNFAEAKYSPIVRVKSEDAEQAVHILEHWRNAAAVRRAERIAAQNSDSDTTTDEDVQLDRESQDGVLWDRYGRRSPLTSAVLAVILVMLLGGFVLSCLRLLSMLLA